jgi:restriction endonuclease Mrr
MYGLIIVTGHFSRAAITEASLSDRSRIRLVDGKELARVLLNTGIGVRKKPVQLPSLDLDSLMTKLDNERG